MITCNRCGTSNPAGTIHCRKCGILLTQMGERGSGGSGTYAGNGGTGSMGSRGPGASTGQPALPAWLESLRSGMGSTGNAGNTPFTAETQSDSDFAAHSNRPSRAGQPGQEHNMQSDSDYNQSGQDNAPPSFHAADLIDDNALPSWLRAVGETGKAAPTPPTSQNQRTAEAANAQPTLRPASHRAPNTDENYFAGSEQSGRAIDANSLVDQQALPPWMRQEQEADLHEQRNISASSLIQPDAMPDWMKNMQASTAAPAPSSPSFMREPAKAPTTDPFQGPQGPQGQQAPQAPQATPTAGQDISAHDLIDPKSLPGWMRQQAEPAEQTGQVGQSGQTGQSGPFSASSLIDRNVLPQWMREESQRGNAPSAPLPPSYSQGQQAPQGAGGPMYAQPANSVWQGPTTPAQGNNPQMSSSPDHTISASSFIDMNALPPWLRQNEVGQQSQQGQQPQYPQQQHPVHQGPNSQAGPQRAAYPVPPRVENMRVPSRPRGEMAPGEGSEVAANVFASMLGVASTTPNFPPAPNYATTPGPQGGQGAQWGQPNSNMPPMSNPPQTQQGLQGGQAGQGWQGGQGGQQGMPPYGTIAGMQPMQQAQGYANMPQQPSSPQHGSMQGGPGGYQGNNAGGNQGQGNYAIGNAPAMPPPMGGQQPGMQNYGQQYGQNQYPPHATNMGNPAKPAMGSEQQPEAKPAKRGLFEAIRSWLFRS